MKLDWLHAEIKVKQQSLEFSANKTPSGARRNLMTEANVHFLLGLAKLEEASKTALPHTRNYRAGDNVADKGASNGD